jgi:small-conductance mechanosensitive channel
MRAINHALTGAFIGLAVAEPVVAIPAAIASHFVLDAIPHHGSQKNNLKVLRSKTFRSTLYADALLCALLVIVLAGQRPFSWFLGAICAFLAAAPDFVWYKRYKRANDHKTWRPGWFERWASDIQWFQRPIGWLVEVAWFIAGVIVVVPFLR